MRLADQAGATSEQGEAPVVGRELGRGPGHLSLCGSPAAQLSLAFPFLLREFSPYTKEKYNCFILSLAWFPPPRIELISTKDDGRPASGRERLYRVSSSFHSS